MSLTYVIAVEGLDALNALDEIPDAVKRAALRAVNKTTARGRTLVSRSIRDQVAFGASYVGPNDGRLTAITAKDKNNPQGIIRARSRPTSLARFSKQEPLAPGQRQKRKPGVKVMVKPGVARFISGAFIIPLKGAGGENLNRGVAIRSETAPRGAYKPKQLGKNVWLLYGPSVAQAMYSHRNEDRQGGVAGQVAPELAEFLEAEFLRLLNVDIP